MIDLIEILKRWVPPAGQVDACDGYCTAPQDIPALVAELKQARQDLEAIRKNYWKDVREEVKAELARVKVDTL